RSLCSACAAPSSATTFPNGCSGCSPRTRPPGCFASSSNVSAPLQRSAGKFPSCARLIWMFRLADSRDPGGTVSINDLSLIAMIGDLLGQLQTAVFASNLRDDEE